MSGHSLRRFSFGGYSSDLADVAVWKFDVLLEPASHRSMTCYVGRSTRGEAFQALFAQYPGAKIFGTGMPLTDREAAAKIGRFMLASEVLIVDDLDTSDQN